MGHRFMYQNLIGDETVITATSVEKGFVGAGVPRVTNAGGSMIFFRRLRRKRPGSLLRGNRRPG